MLKGSVLVALLLAGCGIAPQPSDGTGMSPIASNAATAKPAAHPDAAAYASTHGVTEEEASRRFALDGEIVRLQETLRDNEPSFVSLRLQHEPAYRIVVSFTSDGDHVIGTYVDGTALAGLVEVREVSYSPDELLRIANEAQRVLDAAGIRTNAQIDELNNRVTVGVFDPERLERKLSEGDVELPHGAAVVRETAFADYIDPDITPTPLARQAVRHFPQQLAPDGMRATMAALLEGELLLVDGCLRVSGWGDQTILISWPPDVVLDAGADPVALGDVHGNIIARVGQQIAIGGGEMPTDFRPVPHDTRFRDLDDSCHGPYFLAADMTE